MKLSIITESQTSELKQRLLKAFTGKGKSKNMGLWGIKDEFGCDLEQAAKYAKILTSGQYGEHDIDNKMLHRVRAPQGIHKLLKHFGVDPSIITKLVRLHVDHVSGIRGYLRPSPHDSVAIEQLNNGKRLVAMLKGPVQGYANIPVPWDNTKDIRYVFRPENKDVVDTIIAACKKYGRGPLLDLLHGLAFGYKMDDVFNYVRSDNQELVDSICGHVDQLSQNA